MALKFLLRPVLFHNKYATSVPIVRNISFNNRKESSDSTTLVKTLSALVGSVIIGTAVKETIERNEHSDVTYGLSKKRLFGYVVNAAEDTFEAGARRPDLPTFTGEEVQKHDTTDSFWVTYKNGVYDVTEFLVSHPGGEQILNAGGLSIEPFWNVYGMHRTPEIYRLLETFRIGNLPPDEVCEYSADDLWALEPRRDERLSVKTHKPFNAETPPHLQTQHFDTPNELFYVRQHMPVPTLEAKSHELTITVVGSDGSSKRTVFTLEELERLPQSSVRAALMCAGNRRTEMNQQVKPVKGLDWHSGAIGNAVWTGVYLVHVLRLLGVDLDDTDGKHIIFTGADVDATGVNFSTSVPLHAAVGERARVLLATHMNGRRLPPDHGYPLRVIVPGAPAVRSVKWLESITISSDESPSHWHQKDYRSFNASTTWETADFPAAPPVYSLPVTSALCSPAPGDTVTLDNGARTLPLLGYAYSGGGAKILRVDVSADGGRTWAAAPRLLQDAAPHSEHYAWTLWALDLPLPPAVGEVEIWVKATDSNFNTQPEKFDDIWNIRGILGNAYQKAKIKIERV